MPLDSIHLDFTMHNALHFLLVIYYFSFNFRALLVVLGQLVLLVVLVCKGCLEIEEALDLLAKRVTRYRLTFC